MRAAASGRIRLIAGSFMQRDQRSDHHTHQTANEKMHDFLSDVLNFFGMHVEPVSGKQFQVIDVAGKIINDPEW